MSLIKRFQAGMFARKLRSAAGLPESQLGDVKDQLVSLGPSAIRSVLESLRTLDARESALEILEKLLNDDTLPVYTQALTSTDPSVLDGVTLVLSRVQGYDPTPLLSLFADASVSKARLGSILSAQMKSIQPRTLLSILPDLGKEARVVVFRILEKRADDSIVSEAIRLSTHAEWWMRLHMAKLLAQFPDDQGIRAVIRLVKDENRGVRLEAIQCLGRLKAIAAIPSLCEALRDPDIKLQTAAIDALVYIGDVSAVPHLVEVLKDESEQARRGAVEVLNEVVTVEAIQDSVSALRDEDWWVRVRAADALGTLGGERVVEAVMGLLSHPDDFVRRYAVEILNTVPDQRAVESLIRALDDHDWWVHERAVDALAKTKDPRAVEPLIRLMGREARAIPSCVRALGTIGDPRAVLPVCKMVASESTEVRREALHALKVLAATELPNDLREQVLQTMQSAGAPLERTGARPMEVRRRNLGPESGRPASEIRGTHTPSSGTAATAPATPSHGHSRPLDFQNLEIGVRLADRYRVVRRIGGGGFGAVYLVEDVIVREELVLKVLNPQLSLDESMIRRFVQELKFTRRIAHPSIIRIYDLIDLGGAHGISMEFFAAQDLGRILKDSGVLPVARVLKIAMQVCEGLAAAHEAGVIHRDIKPPNILVGEADMTKIVDFGLASVGSGGGSRLTKSGILVGTPEYISPEQITGGDIDGRTDLYSFGVVMYEALSGLQPFSGENAVNVLFQHLDGEIQPLREVKPEIPAAVDELVGRAMAKDPADRPSSAIELLHMIRAAS